MTATELPPNHYTTSAVVQPPLSTDVEVSRGELERAGPLPGASCEMALWYADRLGWAVFPLAEGVKRPYKGSHGYKDATVDPVAISANFENRPYANVGMAPHLSGTIVLDIDFDRGGEVLYQRMLRKHGDLLKNTPMVKTAGGIHIYLGQPREPVDLNGVGRARSTLYGKGLEILGEPPIGKRQYAVLPYSVLREVGFVYSWVEGQSPHDCAVQLLTPELLHTIQALATEGRPTKVEHKVCSYPVAAGFRDDNRGTDNAGPVSALDLLTYARSEVYAARLAELVGVPFDPDGNSSFPSPLREDKHPSASIYRMHDGMYKYYDWNPDVGRHKYYTLAQLYASWKAGVPLEEMRKANLVVWQVRALFETGMLEKPLVRALPLPQDAPPSAVRAYQGFLELYACRTAYNGRAEAAPYTRRFCAAWLGITEHQAEQGIDWLIREGYLVHVGEVRVGPKTVYTWQPREPSP